MQLGPIFFLVASSVKMISGADWCYHSQITCNDTCTGPDKWGAVSQQCNGRAQSPVNIVTRRLLLDERLSPVQLTGYQEIFSGRLNNNGHSVQLDLPSTLKISGGNLAATYKAVQLHLHWGKDEGSGSEHLIDGEQFPMEMHIVHIKEEYNSLSQAVKDRTGVAVLGFFFQESASSNKKFDPIINALNFTIQPNDNTTVRDISLNMFIPPPENMTKYFRYDGSLTTPNCDEAALLKRLESVVWSVYENTIPLSRSQLAAFSQLQFSDGKPMVGNFRPVQPLNGRQVYYSRGHAAPVSAVLLILAVFVSGTL